MGFNSPSATPSAQAADSSFCVLRPDEGYNAGGLLRWEVFSKRGDLANLRRHSVSAEHTARVRAIQQRVTNAQLSFPEYQVGTGAGLAAGTMLPSNQQLPSITAQQAAEALRASIAAASSAIRDHLRLLIRGVRIATVPGLLAGWRSLKGRRCGCCVLMGPGLGYRGWLQYVPLGSTGADDHG